MLKIKTAILLCTFAIFSTQSSPNYDLDEGLMNSESSPRRRPMYELIAPLVRRHSSISVKPDLTPGPAQIPPAAPPLAKSPLIQRIRRSLPGAE